MASEIYKVSSNYIPDDITFIILSKISLKSLRRFTCASKSWSLLFENPNFMKIYCKRFMSMHQSLYNDTHIFLNIKEILPYEQDGSSLYLLYDGKFQNRRKLRWPTSFQQDEFRTNMIDSGVNDVLCFSDLDDESASLWNPATKEVIHVARSPAESLPFNSFCFYLHGYGYDRVNDDYKIIRHVHLNVNEYTPNDNVDWDYLPPTPRHFWEIYSVRSSSWKRLDLVDVPRGLGRKVYLNGFCHWWADTDGDDAYMVSFNLSNEMFSTTFLPLDMQDSYPDEWVKRETYPIEWMRKYFDLVVLNGFVGMISKHVKTCSFHIYILGEIGVRESWTKIFIVGPLPRVVERPIGAGKKGDLFFIKNDNELVCFDLNTQTIKYLGVKGETYCCDFAICKKNFLRLGGMTN